MITILSRINELAKKEKEEGLTNAERVEQQSLREDYLREIRGQVLGTFSRLTVVDPLGNDVTPEKVRKEKAEQEETEEEAPGVVNRIRRYLD